MILTEMVVSSYDGPVSVVRRVPQNGYIVFLGAHTIDPSSQGSMV